MLYDHEKVTMVRKRAGLRQRRVAPLIGLWGSQLSRRETGKDRFTMWELNALAASYGVGLDAFAPDDVADEVSK